MTLEERADALMARERRAAWPPPVDVEAAALTTDHQNAIRLARKLGAGLLYVPSVGWHCWAGTHWRRDETRATREAAKLGRVILDEAGNVARDAQDVETAGNLAEALIRWASKSESAQRITAAMALARGYLARDVADLDADPWILNTPGGVVDLRTGQARPARSGDFCTKLTRAAYNPRARAPVFEKFVARTFDGDAELIAFVQRLFGYGLTGLSTEHVLAVLWGSGANGKSTLVNAIMHAMGGYAHQAPPGLLEARTGERHPTELADLRGARLAVAAEFPEGGRLAESLVKSLTGGDRIKGRLMRQDFFEFVPSHLLAVTTNHRPAIRGNDEGIWRRMLLVPFTVTIPPAERDTTLPRRLEDEADGILRWLVEGCLAWQRDGLNPPEKVRAAVAEYRTESDVVRLFIADECYEGAQYRAQAKSLYEAYRAWSEEQGARPMTNTAFGRRLVDLGFPKSKGFAGSMYHGIGLRETHHAAK